MSLSAPSKSKFGDSIDAISRERHSRIVLALDPAYTEDTRKLLSAAKETVDATEKFVCGVKINFHLIFPLSISELSSLNEYITSKGLLSIADIKLNDIGNTNRIAVDYLWKGGFSAVIVNPFVGFEGGLDSVFESARSRGKGVITLTFMSHVAASEGYGLKLEDGSTIFELFLQRALSWSADGVIIGSTQPEKIRFAKSKLDGSPCKIFSPGSGAQGGDPTASLEAGSDYLIYGRSIVASMNPQAAVKEIYHSLLPWVEGKN